MDEIYETHGHLLTTIDHPWLTRAKLREMADAVHEVGAALPNCWGFVDGTVNIRKNVFLSNSSISLLNLSLHDRSVVLKSCCVLVFRFSAITLHTLPLSDCF